MTQRIFFLCVFTLSSSPLLFCNLLLWILDSTCRSFKLHSANWSFLLHFLPQMKAPQYIHQVWMKSEELASICLSSTGLQVAFSSAASNPTSESYTWRNTICTPIVQSGAYNLYSSATTMHHNQQQICMNLQTMRQICCTQHKVPNYSWISVLPQSHCPPPYFEKLFCHLVSLSPLIAMLCSYPGPLEDHSSSHASSLPLSVRACIPS